MILNILHLPHPLPDRSISTSNNRCVSPPSVYAKFLATRTHTHAPKHSRNARAEKEGGGSVSRRTVGTRTGPGSGISGGRGTPSTPRMQPIYLDSRRVGLCAPSSSILEEVATCSVLYHRRFFHVTPNLSCRDDF